MKGMQWVVGAVALVVFDAALIWGVRYWQAHRVPGLEVAPPAVVPAVSATVVSTSPAALPLQTACVNGSVYAYRADWQRWGKTPLTCEVKSEVIRIRPRASGQAAQVI